MPPTNNNPQPRRKTIRSGFWAGDDDALVNLGQKELLVETQGNWGDIRPGGIDIIANEMVTLSD